MKLRNNQSGIAHLAAIIVVAVITVIGLVGWKVWDNNKEKSKVSSSTSVSSSSPVGTTLKENKPDPYTNWKKYTSTKGGFSIKYPNDWVVAGFKEGTIVEETKLSGDEDQLRVQQKSEADNKSNNFAINLNIGTGLVEYNWASDLNKLGSVKVLSKDITILDEAKTQNLPSGEQANDCPTVWVVSENHIGLKLINGNYLDFSGSYCWGQGMTSTLTFDEQKASQPYQDTLLVLKSFAYN